MLILSGWLQIDVGFILKLLVTRLNFYILTKQENIQNIKMFIDMEDYNQNLLRIDGIKYNDINKTKRKAPTAPY